jgi:hypothetical protein
MLVGGLDIGRFTDRSVLIGMEDAVVSEAHMLSGLPFKEQARILAPLVQRMDLVLVDVTGLGIGLYEMLADTGANVIPVTLGSSSQPKIIAPGNRRERHIYVGKNYLIGRMLGVINARELSISPVCMHRDEMRQELLNLRRSYTAKGRLSIAARTGHDDFPLALSLAILSRDMHSRLSRGTLDGTQAEGRYAGRGAPVAGAAPAAG